MRVNNLTDVMYVAKNLLIAVLLNNTCRFILQNGLTHVMYVAQFLERAVILKHTS